MTMNTAKFEKLPDRLPPVNTVGWVAWVKQNLFGSVSNTIITLLFFYLMFLYIPPFLEWAVFNANISGSDRTTCDENRSGACWTFIKVRMEQLLFGLYFAQNPDQMWRPIMAFIVFGGLLTPLAIDRTPYKKWLLLIF